MRYTGVSPGSAEPALARGIVHGIELVVPPPPSMLPPACPPPILPLPLREPMGRRAVSSPAVSLLTTSGGRAALGEADSLPPLAPETLPCALATTNDGHGIIEGALCKDDRAIWRRMESSSAVDSGSSDPVDADHSAPTSGDAPGDDEELTLRRLAQRRAQRSRAPQRAHSWNGSHQPCTDARLEMQERVGSRRAGSLKRKPSISLALAADRDLFVDKENIPPVTAAPYHCSQAPGLPLAPKGRGAPFRRVDSVPVRPLQERQLNSFMGPLHSYMPVNSLRRTVSASSHPATKPAPNWTRTSSARSDIAIIPPAKNHVQDDSGFFEDDDVSVSNSPPCVPKANHVLPAFSEHDKEAATLLLGLRSHP